MKMPKVYQILRISTLLLIVGVLVPSMAVADSGADSGFGNSGIGVATWVVDPATGELIPSEPGAPNLDPNQYKYELQCHLGGGDFDSVCLRDQIEFKYGPDG
jgi:hypothetical protein